MHTAASIVVGRCAYVPTAPEILPTLITVFARRTRSMLSFTAACVLPVENDEKQALLEHTDTAARLAVEREVLLREVTRLRRAAEASEEVAVVDVVVDLGPLALREHVLDVERVPAEASGERLHFVVRRPLEMEPGEAVLLKLSDRALRGLGPKRRLAGAARTDAWKARHRY